MTKGLFTLADFVGRQIGIRPYCICNNFQQKYAADTNVYGVFNHPVCPNLLYSRSFSAYEDTTLYKFDYY